MEGRGSGAGLKVRLGQEADGENGRDTDEAR